LASGSTYGLGYGLEGPGPGLRKIAASTT